MLIVISRAPSKNIATEKVHTERNEFKKVYQSRSTWKAKKKAGAEE